MILTVCDKPCQTCKELETCSGALEYGAHDEEKLKTICPRCGTRMKYAIGREGTIAEGIEEWYCPKCGYIEGEGELDGRA